MLVGRDSETEVIEQVLASARAGQSAVLVLRGEPGVGKTALLRHAVDQATELLVLRATGFESEAELAFSGLLEICRPLLDLIDELAPAQREPLSSALGVASGPAPDRFSVAAATLALLAQAAERTPVLVVVDDAHWLDGASLDALLFAARRLTVDPVAFLFATRAEGLADVGLEELAVEGLDVGAGVELVRRAAAGRITTEVATLLVQATNGNPLALVELPAHLSDGQLAGHEPVSTPVPLGTRLEQAFAGRIGMLPEPARRTLAVFAATDGDVVAPARRALETLGLGDDEIAACEDAELLHVQSDRFRFPHPLLRSAAYGGMTPSERRAAHRALAAAFEADGDAERRASHLGLAAVAPDDEAAAALEEAATVARSRNAFAAAATALEQAARLVSGRTRQEGLILDAAQAAYQAGAATRAYELANTLLATGLDDDGHRARALRISGRVELQVGHVERSYERLLEASRLTASTDPVLAGNSLYFACLALFQSGRVAEQIALAEEAVALDGVETMTGRTVSGYMLGQALTMAGRTDEARPWLERAYDTFRDSGEVATTLVGDRRAAFCLFLLGRTAEGAELAEHALAQAREKGPLEVVWALITFARIAFQQGEWKRLLGTAVEAVELSQALGQHGPRTELELLLARTAAARGDDAGFGEWTDRATAHVERSGYVLGHADRQWGLGRLALAHDRLEDAALVLGECADAVTEMGMIDRELSPEPDLVEALVRLDRRDDALGVLERWIARGAAGARPWAPPLVAALRGLLAADGDFDECFAEALGLHADLADSYLEARTRLLYGERLRRAGRRVDAREQLRIAHASFVRLECTAWCDRARRELRASGERLRSAASAGDELTPQELEIALQVAAGHPNKGVAAALFLSPKTVEFHLSRIYRKLDISSRAELVRRFANESVAAG